MELFDFKVGVKLAIDACEQIEIERGGHAFAIVVGSEQRRQILAQIDADDRAALRARVPAQLLQERGGLVRVEIADRRAGKERDAARPRNFSGEIEIDRKSTRLNSSH